MTIGGAGRCGMAAALLAIVVAQPVAAARPGAIAGASHGGVTITASVAGQARLSGDGAALCLSGNSATRLIDVTAQDDTGASRSLTPAGYVAAPLRDCATGRAPDDRRLLAGIARSASGGPVAILVSPE